ncbi:hypothetical protein CKO33_02580 [Ectothiorhodospira mobilis]|nr:hypothetical protein [Ectothiorhodospira mobilis]
MITCPQIYATLCDHERIMAALSCHLPRPTHMEVVAAEIQSALIWGEYRHGDHPVPVSEAIESHLVGVLAASDATLFRRHGGDERCQASARGSICPDGLCASATPLSVADATLRHTGCRRTADLVGSVAEAHADNAARTAPLPCSAPASSLFAATVIADMEAELERRLPGVAYSRQGFDLAIFHDSQAVVAAASAILDGMLAEREAAVKWRHSSGATLAPARALAR